jgi:hypothetical protein
MTARHTPGPWSIGDENNACCDVLLGTEHNLTCSMDRRDNNTFAEVISREEMLANAHLIAAAPDLLEACQKLVDWDEREKDHAIGFMERIFLCAEAFELMNAAIAKATGEPSP